ncbi:MAG: DUF4783 domain-containing protein [Cryomorphaceae bacterium]|nr:DUF4783 domain-containing protein [Flavobacteriales bacterium]
MVRFYTCFFAVFLMGSSFAQDVERDQVSLAVKSGNAKALAAYFTPGVNLTVDQKEDVYSREQAEVIMNRFFTNHLPSGFDIRHEGKSKLDDHFYIGDLTTGNGNYRVTFFMKKEEEGFKIRQLRIEPE